jgi:HK97 gp10 family phage protein
MPAAKVKFRIESAAVAELADKLAQMDRKAARVALKKGVNEATKIVLWDAKARTPRRSGQLRKSLGRLVKTYRGGAIVAGIVGPRKGFRVQWRGKYIDPVKYAHLVEFGRKEVVAGVGRGGKKTGKRLLSDGTTVFGPRVRAVPPRPFLRPAWDENKGRVVQVIIDALRKGLRDFLARYRGRRAA